MRRTVQDEPALASSIVGLHLLEAVHLNARVQPAELCLAVVLQQKSIIGIGPTRFLWQACLPILAWCYSLLNSEVKMKSAPAEIADRVFPRPAKGHPGGALQSLEQAALLHWPPGI